MIRYEVGTRTILVGLLCAAGFSGSWGYELFPTEDSTIRSNQAAAMARLLTLALPDFPARSRVAVATLSGDDSGRLEVHLREWLGRRNLIVVTPAWWDRATRLVGEQRTVRDSAVVLGQLAEHRTADYLLSGEVLDWTTFPVDGAVLRAAFRVDDAQTGKTVLEQTLTYPATTPATPHDTSLAPAVLETDHPTGWGHVSLVWRIMIWAIAVFLAPSLAGGLISSLLARESNAINAGLLAGLVLAATGSAWLIWAGSLGSGIGPLVTLIAGVTTVPYLGYACGQLNQFRDV
jgi:hypothetical protein